ncbi:AAA family ATPase [Cyclobacterium sp. SYSU L10401]|uniref:AAA family ATPase n=1 Tax=Cyclobacterium sp. SYSU L10401 TaxID=2678657 RepID=UPI0013D4E737|nr:AAA family ATPase [Cyclobacterium sp. SYSU L10401]
MYISSIHIKNYRNFEDTEVLFNPGLNIIIGHNNAGKTNLIKALQLLFNRGSIGKPSIEDFNAKFSDFDKPPKIEISVKIKELKGEGEDGDDKNVVYDWLIKDSPNYVAQLTYVFELPSKHLKEYETVIQTAKGDGNNYDIRRCQELLFKKFLPKYVTRIYGGDPSRQEKADTENLDKFDFQFLDAIRDAEKQMFYGNNTLLRDILSYFLDYDLTKGASLEVLSEEELKTLEKREDEFREKSDALLNHLIGRIDKNQILQYSKDTGADRGGEPDFDAKVSEKEILFALRLIVKHLGLNIPIKNNGLGYNNLLFIALILAKMQMESSSSQMGENAKIFPILAIEEPEAHLHPSMQSKFLKFLNENLKSQKQARQIFISSHSTHITSAVGLDSVICLYKDYQNEYKIGYPGRVFDLNNKKDKNSKQYIERFLDATKSNMLFAERLIFVEGTAEQILLPCFAEYLELEDELIDTHTAIISVDSRTFNHFLKIFAYDELVNPYAINKTCVCITDADPTKKKGEKWISAFPFELDKGPNSNELSSHVAELKNDFETKHQNIFVYHPEAGKGVTLEYDLALQNPKSDLLITDAFPSQNSPHTANKYNSISSKGTLKEVMDEYMKSLAITDLQENRILKAIENSTWKEKDKKKALMAAIYLTIVKKSKGAHAFYLEKNLRDNYALGSKKQDFKIPGYIKNAITKVTS